MSARVPARYLRKYLWLTRLEPVHSLSPVLVDALGAVGIDAGDLIEGIGRRRRGMLRSFAYQELARTNGTLHLLDPTGTLRDCMLQRSGDCLEMKFAIGDIATVRTIGDRCRLTLATVIPETIAAAARGRRLGDVVDHPLLRDCAYRVRSARVLERVGVTVISFDAPRVPLGSARASTAVDQAA